MKIMLLFNIVKLITGKKTHLTPRIVIVLSVVTKKTETCKYFRRLNHYNIDNVIPLLKVY